MAKVPDIKRPNEWDFYWFINIYAKYRGVVYKKCAVAKEPRDYSIRHGVFLIADDLTIVIAPYNSLQLITVGNLKKISFEDVGV